MDWETKAKWSRWASEQQPTLPRNPNLIWVALLLLLLAMHLMGVLERNDLSAQILEESVQRAECQRIGETHAQILDSVLVGATLTHGDKKIQCRVRSS